MKGGGAVGRRIGFGVALGAILVVFLAPYLWQVITSLKPPEELGKLPPILPQEPRLDAYRAIFAERSFGRVLLNSFIVAGASTLLSLAIGSLAAFTVVFLPARGKGAVMAVLLSIAMLPQVAILGPIYLGAKELGLRDGYAGLIAPYTALGLPLTVWFLSGFFRRVPVELYRAARIDGCSPMAAFRKVLLPLAAPGLATTAIFVFILAWNELLFALTITVTPRSRTIPVQIALFSGLHEVPWARIAAASVVASLPLVLMVVFLQRRIVAGLMSGSLKE